MSESANDPAQEAGGELVEGLWTRLRNVLIALDRVDRLETANDFTGWADGLAQDEALVNATTRDWILRALRTAADPLNYQILSALTAGGEQSIAELMEGASLRRVELSERIKDLAQAGFVAHALESDRVRATPAAEGIVLWVETLRERIAERARAGLTKDNPPPRAHRPRPFP